MIPNSQTAHRIRCLIVCDDDARYRRQLARALRDETAAMNTTVYEAEHAEAALEAVREYKADTVVVDLRMPGQSGLWLIQELQQRHPETRSVILTGFGSIATALDAVRLGATNYLTKPATPKQILAAFFPEESPTTLDPSPPSLAEVEAEYVNRVLAENSGNISRSAKVLGVDRRSLQRKLRRG